MKEIDTNIWVHETEFKFLGADFGNRMTIIRLSGNRLLLHSPVKIDNYLVSLVRELGDVSYIVTPNNFHGVFVDEWVTEFPHASHFTAQYDDGVGGTEKPISQLIGEISNEIDIVKIEGVPKANEYAFIHRESNTLILTDIAFNIGSDVSIWSKIFFKLNGALNLFGPTRLMKSMISSPDELKVSIQKILSFDIDRVIVSHGDILETKAKETLERAFEKCHSGHSKQKSGKLSLSRCG